MSCLKGKEERPTLPSSPFPFISSTDNLVFIVIIPLLSCLVFPPLFMSCHHVVQSSPPPRIYLTRETTTDLLTWDRLTCTYPFWGDKRWCADMFLSRDVSVSQSGNPFLFVLRICECLWLIVNRCMGWRLIWSLFRMKERNHFRILYCHPSWRM